MGLQPILEGVRVSDLITTPIEIAASGDNSVIAAPAAGLRTVILHVNWLCRDVVTVRLRSAATNLSGPYNFTATTGFAFDGGIVAPLVLGIAEAFVINLSAAVGLDGFVIHYPQRG